ncbi:MAG: hypothetical protein AAF193_11530, partial [Bacteroidota bacterium]
LFSKVKKWNSAAKMKLYPLYSFGYMGYWKVQFLNFPKLIFIPTTKKGYLVIGYSIEAEKFALCYAEYQPDHDHLINMEGSEDFNSSDIYFKKLLCNKQVLHVSHDMEELMNFIRVTL